jgi:aminoglycoside phosphotransferase (APT) family kinase protein
MSTARLTLATVLLSLAMCSPAFATPTDLRSPDARDAASAQQIARTMERYYSSYGAPQPLPTAQDSQSPVPADDGTPWIVFVLVAGGAVAVGTQLHRLRPRRHRPAGALS